MTNHNELYNELDYLVSDYKKIFVDEYLDNCKILKCQETGMQEFSDKDIREAEEHANYELLNVLKAVIKTIK